MTLYEKLLPQAKELIQKRERRYPATTKVVIDHLNDEKYNFWTELPYYIVKMMHESVFNADSFDLIEEEEIRMIFEDYYESD